MNNPKHKWYTRKDKTHVLKVGNWKVLEIFKRPGGYYCCFVFKKGKLVADNGYKAPVFPKKDNAIKWGWEKAKTLKIIKL